MKTAIVGIILAVAITVVAVLAMAFRPLFVRKGRFGRFPNTHICKSKFKD